MKNTVILGSAILILTMLLSQVSYAQQSVAPYAFRTVQAENATEISGLTTNSNRAFGADPGDYLRFDNINLNGGMDSFRLRYAKGNSTELVVLIDIERLLTLHFQ